MTRFFRTIFAALSLCLLLASARPAAACGGPEDFALMQVYDFLRDVGLDERVESVSVKLDEARTHGQATVKLKQVSKPLVLGVAYTDEGWVITSRHRSDS
ncbi:MAG: hypothetical protein R3B07_00365 [Polyangiaceae bacterium]